MKNIFEVIKEDHEKQRLLMNALIETTGSSKSRIDLFDDLKKNLQVHSIAEERCFYAPLIEHDNTIEHSRHGIAEHHQLDKLIASLESTPMDSPNWLKVMKELQHKVLHHLAEEEHQFFQQAGKVLKDKEKHTLAEQYLKEMA